MGSYILIIHNVSMNSSHSLMKTLVPVKLWCVLLFYCYWSLMTATPECPKGECIFQQKKEPQG